MDRELTLLVTQATHDAVEKKERDVVESLRTLETSIRGDEGDARDTGWGDETFLKLTACLARGGVWKTRK